VPLPAAIWEHRGMGMGARLGAYMEPPDAFESGEIRNPLVA